MKQLIDKDALVAEIKRLIDGCYKICAGDLDFLQRVYPEHYYSIENYKDILSFINTLEGKEIDLEKEINKYISDNFFGSETMGFFSNRTKEEPNDKDIALCAKHFFELGLRAAQKGE